jgi:hypothetical protein
MGREYITIFNQEYRNNAKPRRNEGDKKLESICRACERPFQENEPIHVCYCGNIPRRRHIACAIEKKITTEADAEKLWDKVAQDMHVSFKAVMKQTLAYQLYQMRKNEKRKTT